MFPGLYRDKSYLKGMIIALFALMLLLLWLAEALINWGLNGVWQWEWGKTGLQIVMKAGMTFTAIVASALWITLGKIPENKNKDTEEGDDEG